MKAAHPDSTNQSNSQFDQLNQAGNPPLEQDSYDNPSSSDANFQQDPPSSNDSFLDRLTTRRGYTILASVVLVALAVASAVYYFTDSMDELDFVPTRQPTSEVVIAPSLEDTDPLLQEDLPPLEREVLPQSVKLMLETAEAGHSAGVSSEIRVMISSDQPVDGVEFVINYNPGQLTNVSLSSSPLFRSVIRESVDEDEGVVSFLAVASPNEVIQPTNEVLATITATPVQSDTITLDFDVEKTLVAAGAGQNVLEQALDLSFNVR